MMKGVFSQIILPRQYPKSRAKHEQRECVGWDTETQAGYARIISDGSTYAEISSLDEALDYMTRKEKRQTIGVMYNLNFDVTAITKYHAPLFRELARKGVAEYADYQLRFIPSKSFVIRRNPQYDRKRGRLVYKKTHYFYDIAQFYEGTSCIVDGVKYSGLAASAYNYLGRKPHELKGDRARLFDLHPTPRIGAYCIDDAKNTADLATLITGSLNKQGLVTNKLFSCGYVAKQYAKTYADVPTARDVPRVVNKLYHQAYRGGWFDTLKHGMTLHTTAYDLKSAYPWALRQLPDLRRGSWKKGLSGELGVVYCDVTGSGGWGQPLAVKFAGRNVYPVFDEPYRTAITLGEYRALQENYSIKPIMAYSFHPEKGCTRPYEGLLGRLFKEKSSHPPNDARYLMAKRIMNSFYGVSAELRKEGGYWKAGPMFNPCYAAEITARVRMRLYETLRGLQGKVVSLLTDSIVFDSPVPLATGKGLGDWELKHVDEKCVTLSSGVYEYEGGERATRGFSRSNSLFSILDVDGEVVTVTHRPTKMREAVIQNRVQDAGVFADVKRVLSLDSDLKRLWPDSPTPRDLLARSYESKPHSYSALKLVGKTD